MIDILVMLVTLGIVVILLQKKVNLGNAMLAGSCFLFLTSSPHWSTLEQAAGNLFFSASTWEILFALYLVMCLEYQLRTTGIIDGLMTVSRVLLKSDKVLLPLMPAFLGFLPSLGGAIFSAPLVEAAGKPYSLSAERKTAINYWFRHLWECTNPIIPALLLASNMANVPLGDLIANMLWVTGVCLFIGWFYYIYPLKSQVRANSTDNPPQQAHNYRYLLLAGGPIIANLVMVVGFKLSPATAMFLVVAAMTALLRLPLADITGMIKHAFAYKLLWGVIGILFFQYVLTATGIIGEVAAILQHAGVPVMIVISIVGFTAGLLTGSSQGAVAITFPFVAAISSHNVSVAALAYVASFVGQMLSPAHLCLLVTLDYFKADFFRSQRSIAVLSFLLLLVLTIKTTVLFNAM